MKNRFCIATLVWVVASNTFCNAQELFTWKLQKGLVLDSQIIQSINAGVSQEIEMTQKWEVKNVLPSGTAEVATTMTRTRLKMTVPGLTDPVEIDTENPESSSQFAKVLLAVFKPMIGVACTNKMEPSGKISDVVIPDEALVGLKALPNSGPISSMLKESIEKGSPVFPDKPLQKGEKWSQVSETNTPLGILESENQYTYLGPTTIDGKFLHQFSIDTKMKYKDAKNKVAITAQEIKGRLLFDNVAGYIVLSEVEQKLTTEIELPGAPKQSQQVFQKITNTFKPSVK